MKASELCYWLQGHFELSGDSNATLTSTQIKIIALHLRMVDVHDRTDGRARQFCNHLTSCINLLGDVDFSSSQTAKIRQILSEVFLHEIDPSYPVEEIQQLNQIHSGFEWNAEPGTRC